MIHLHRKLIAFRWILSLLIILTGLSWIYYELPSNLRVNLPPIKNYTNTIVKIPPASERRILRMAVNILQKSQHDYLKITYDDLRPSLFLLKKKKKKSPSPMLNITMIFLGGKNRYVMIDGRIYREGETLIDGRKILNISEKGVLIKAKDNVYLVPWKETGYVKLERSSFSTSRRHSEKASASPSSEDKGQEELNILKKLLQSKKTIIINKSIQKTKTEK